MIFSDLKFDADLLNASTETGEIIKFTKRERAMLSLFTANPGKLLNRQQLLDVVTSIGSDSLDRNIDHLVSRLRKKLGDRAGAPRYIATQYGEGYVWVAVRQDGNNGLADFIYLSIGPLYGLDKACKTLPDLAQFPDKLQETLRRTIAPRGTIALRPTSVHERALHDRADFALQLNIVTHDLQHHCHYILLSPKTGLVHDSNKISLDKFEQPTHAAQILEDFSTALAAQLRSAQIFNSDQNQNAISEPLSVSLHKAAQLFEPGTERLELVEKSLRQQHQQQPEEHRTAILLAINLNSQIFAGNFDALDERLEEIKALVFANIASLQNDALYLSAIADLVYGLGYRELGQSLAQRALDIGPTFAACYLVLGRIYMSNGDIESALDYFAQSLEMTDEGTPFHELIEVNKAIAHKALGQTEKNRELASYVVAREPNPVRKYMKQAMLLAGDREALPLTVKAALRLLPKSAIQHYLKIYFYITARTFKHEHHREALLHGLVHYMVELHGASVVPAWIKESVPSLMPKLVKN